jgi:hypothetical protein
MDYRKSSNRSPRRLLKLLTWTSGVYFSGQACNRDPMSTCITIGNANSFAFSFWVHFCQFDCLSFKCGAITFTFWCHDYAKISQWLHHDQWYDNACRRRFYSMPETRSIFETRRIEETRRLLKHLTWTLACIRRPAGIWEQIVLEDLR